jgi:predicted MFS family arabinose efflux permease
MLTSFWTTLTFLLTDAPYYYSTVAVGLFGFVGLGPMFLGPVISRVFIDRFHPFLSIVIGNIICLGANGVGTYTGTFTIAGPVIQAACFDLGQSIAQTANRTNIYSVAPKAGNRVNTAYMLFFFCGQLTGTALGNRLFAQGGWFRSGSASVGLLGTSLVICFIRGPHETRWIGWRDGFDVHRKKEPPIQEEKTQSGDTGQVDA